MGDKRARHTAHAAHSTQATFFSKLKTKTQNAKPQYVVSGRRLFCGWWMVAVLAVLVLGLAWFSWL
jgi:hypothetical protein